MASSSLPHATSLVASTRQRALWGAATILAGTSLLNHSAVFRLSGDLDVEAFAQAVRRLSERQRQLRTVFGADGSASLAACPSLQIHDLRHTANAAAQIQAIITSVCDAPFVLTAEPLFRAALVMLEDTLHVFVCTLHVLIWDRRSMSILLDDLAALYRSARDGTVATSLADLTPQYSDLAKAEQTKAMQARFAANGSYWRRQLNGLPAVALPSDPRSLPSGELSPTGRSSLSLGPAIRAGLRRFCREQRSTLFITAAAALMAMVHAETGQDDLRVSTAIENRTTRAARHLVGPFSQGFVLRARTEPGMTFQELVQRAQRAFLEGMAHQALPFDNLVELLEADGTPRAWLADPSLFIEPGPPMLVLPEIESSPIANGPEGQVESVGSAFDLRLIPNADALERAGEGLPCVLFYDASLFKLSQADALLGAFAAVLRSGTTAPGTRLADMSDSLRTPAWNL